MIEILQKNKELLKVKSTSKISNENLDFHLMQFIDYSESELDWLRKRYNLDFTIMKHYQDIEISSHFLEDDNQASFHFSIPYFNKDKRMVEEPVFIIATDIGLFLFLSRELEDFFTDIYSNKIKSVKKLTDTEDIFMFLFEFISDYFADITENSTKRIKILANKILIDKEFSNEELDVITRHNFSNLLIKEALLETTRIFTLYIKSHWEKKTGIKKRIQIELSDLSAISDYIQFNFDRLDDLKENVSSKIDLEQNHIFKMLTVVTVCISLPTFIAGLYGMNFDDMPELKAPHGYPIVIILMLLSALLPFIYFKRKKWLK
jgi:magnesium transporter